MSVSLCVLFNYLSENWASVCAFSTKHYLFFSFPFSFTGSGHMQQMPMLLRKGSIAVSYLHDIHCPVCQRKDLLHCSEKGALQCHTYMTYTALYAKGRICYVYGQGKEKWFLMSLVYFSLFKTCEGDVHTSDSVVTGTGDWGVCRLGKCFLVLSLVVGLHLLPSCEGVGRFWPMPGQFLNIYAVFMLHKWNIWFALWVVLIFCSAESNHVLKCNCFPSLMEGTAGACGLY